MKRSLASISLLNPPNPGDIVSVAGVDWQIAHGAYGWLLHKPGDRLAVHPTIKDIFSLLEFLAALELGA